MKVMCLNCWGGKLSEALIDYVRRAEPDILCLQEVVRTLDAPKTWLTYRDGATGLQQRANFFEEVRDALPHHTAIFCPAARGDLWNEAMSYPSDWGIATFVHERFPIIGQRQGFVHRAYSPDGYGDHPRSRSAHAIRVYDFDSDRSMTIAHMHGLRDPKAGKSDTPARIEQARRLADLVSSVSEDVDRLVVCGDFNVLPGSATFDILRKLGLSDLVTARAVKSTRTSHYEKPIRFADYMLVDPSLRSAPFEVVMDPEVSDHCPLILTVR